MLFETIKNEIFNRLGPFTQTPSGFQVRNCPMCVHMGHRADKRKRFGLKIEKETIVTNCFNCSFKAVWTYPEQFSAKFTFLLKVAGVDDNDIKSLKFALFKEKASVFIDDNEELVLKKSVQSTWKPIQLPKNAKPLDVWLKEDPTNTDLIAVANYALHRRLLDLDVFYWDKDQKRRLILPFYYQNSIVGYTSRAIDDVKSSKYINIMPESFIYNLDAQQNYHRKYLIVSEGVFDAYLTSGVSPLGSMNQEQANIINNLDKQVIVIPDRDKKGRELVDVALDMGWAVSFPKWEDHVKDPAQAAAEYGRIYTVESIIKSAEYNPVKIRLKRKIYE